MSCFSRRLSSLVGGGARARGVSCAFRPSLSSSCNNYFSVKAQAQATATANTKTQPGISLESASISKSLFGQMPECGSDVHQYTLQNSLGMKVEILDFGGHIRSMQVPDHSGSLIDVTIGLDDMAAYADRSRNAYFGCIVGRYANRIRNGKFSLTSTETKETKETEYTLATNNGENHLHGGVAGFDTKLWQVREASSVGVDDDHKDCVLTLTYVSAHMEEGYPGDCRVAVKYTLYNASNTLGIEYSAETDSETVVNLTNHAYFNLNSSSISATNASSSSSSKFFKNAIIDGSHELLINSDFITAVDAQCIPIGHLQTVDDTVFDFRAFRNLGESINDAFADEQLRHGQGYDHNFMINKMAEEAMIENVAVLRSKQSGVQMAVHTDQPGIQLYTGNFLDGSAFKGKGHAYHYRSALCLETQHFPNAPNQPNFASTLITKDKPLKTCTQYAFSNATAD